MSTHHEYISVDPYYQGSSRQLLANMRFINPLELHGMDLLSPVCRVGISKAAMSILFGDVYSILLLTQIAPLVQMNANELDLDDTDWEHDLQGIVREYNRQRFPLPAFSTLHKTAYLCVWVGVGVGCIYMWLCVYVRV